MATAVVLTMLGQAQAVVLTMLGQAQLSVSIQVPSRKPAFVELNPLRGLPGVQGPMGPAGPAGPAGPSADYLEFVQSSPQSEWIVNHNFGKYPIVDVLSPGGISVEAECVHTSTNQLRIHFITPQSGRALVR